MDKKEFLDVLRQFLQGEVSEDVIEQNIKYYEQYISSQSTEEEARVIEMLGDPRLIAKTVIETEKAAKQKGRAYNDDVDSHSRNFSGEEEKRHNKDNRNHGRNVFNINLTWRQKAILIFIMIIVILLIIVVGRIIIGFLFTFGVPILLLILLYTMFKKRN